MTQCVPLAFLGALWAAGLFAIPWSVAFLPCAAGAVALLGARRRRDVAAGMVFLGMTLGLLRGAPSTRPPAASPLAQALAVGPAMALRGVVVEPPAVLERSQRLRLRVDAIRRQDGRWQTTSGTAQATLAVVPGIPERAVVELQGRIVASGADGTAAVAPGRTAVDAVTVFPAVELLGQDAPGPLTLPWPALSRSPFRWTTRTTIDLTIGFLRPRLASSLEALLPEPQSVLVTGILLGQSGSLPASLRQQLSRSGTSHIVAVSGYNVGLVVGVATAGAAGALGTGRRRRGQLPVVLLASVALWGFVSLVGASGSVLRAAAMAQLALAGRATGREGDAGGLLLWGNALLASARPDIVDDVGWQLSFMGTAGLIWLAPALGAFRGRLPAMVWEGLAATVAAQVFVLPVLASTFGRISVVAPLANCLALPLVPPIMLGGTATVAAAALWPPAGPLLAALTWVPATALLQVVAWSAALPWAEVTLPSWSPAATGAYLGGLVLLCAGRQWWIERVPFSGAPGGRRPAGPPQVATPLPALVTSALLALAAVGGAMLWRGGPLTGRPALRLTLPAIPAGTLVAATAPDGVKVLLDGGPGTSAATTLLGDVLRPWDRTVDVVVMTDPAEPYVVGLTRVLQRYRIGTVLDATSDDASPGYRQVQDVVRRGGVPRLRAEPDSAVVVGSALRLEMLGTTTITSTNTTSSDLPAWRLRWGAFSLLIPGEDSGTRWSAIAATAPPLRCTVLLLTERAARGRAVAGLVQAVEPALVVVQGQARSGTLPARAGPADLLDGSDLTPGVRPGPGRAALWHYTARDGALRLEVTSAAFRLDRGPWLPLPPLDAAPQAPPGAIPAVPPGAIPAASAGAPAGAE